MAEYIYTGKARSLTLKIYQTVGGTNYEIIVSPSGQEAFSINGNTYGPITDFMMARLSDADFNQRLLDYYDLVMQMYPQLTLPDDLTVQAVLDDETCFGVVPTTTEAPTTQEPTTVEPTTDAPTTSLSTTEESTTVISTTEGPTTTLSLVPNSYQVKTTNTLEDICIVETITVYSNLESTWAEGTALYTNGSLTNLVNTSYIVLVSDGVVRNVSGGVLGTATGDNCGVV